MDVSGNHHQTTMPRCRESKATYCIKFSGYSGYSKIIVSCPHSNRVGTTIAVLPACSHYYLQVIMTSNLSSGVGLGGERKSRTYKNQIHRGIPLPEIFAPKKKSTCYFFLNQSQPCVTRGNAGSKSCTNFRSFIPSGIS